MTDQPADHAPDHRPDHRPDTDSRRIPVIAGVSVLVAGVLAGGAFAASQILGTGAQPENVMPHSVIAFASVDIDPGARQKVEAIRTLRKFPELRDAIRVGEEDDIRRRIFEEAIGDGDCKGKVDYASDVEPWLGDKAGVAALDLGADAPSPLVALQVSDEDAAAKGVDKLKGCDRDGSKSAYTFRDGFMLVSDSQAHLDEAMAAAGERSLADDEKFAQWDDAAGGDGIVNFYVSKRATEFLGRMVPEELTGRSGDMEKSLKDFEGMAGALRFADEGIELEVAAGGAQAYLGSGTLGDALTKLPEDTALATAVAVPDDFAALVMARIEDTFGAQAETLLEQAESQTGLSFPEDLQTLFGQAIVLALGGDAPADIAATSGPGDLPLGVKIIGDPDKIKAVIGKAEERSGQRLSDADIVQAADDNAYIMASNREFAEELSSDGRLGDDPAFNEVVPRGGDSSFAIFVDFGSAWRDSILSLVKDRAGEDTARRAEANTAALEALGVSGWVDDKVSHALVKLSTE